MPDEQKAYTEKDTKDKPATEKPSLAAPHEKPEVKSSDSKPSGDLQPAGESSNPLVHQALGELEIAQRNRDSLEVEDADIERADAEVEAAKAKLKDLGVGL